MQNKEGDAAVRGKRGEQGDAGHLEVSTTAANSADALVSNVASVRGGEPTYLK